MKYFWFLWAFSPSFAFADPSDLSLLLVAKTAHSLSQAEKMEDLADRLSLNTKSKKAYLDDLKQSKMLGKSLEDFKVEDSKIIFLESKMVLDFSQIDQHVLLINSKKVSLDKKGDYWQSKLHVDEALRLSKKTSRLQIFVEAAFAKDGARGPFIGATVVESTKSFVQKFAPFDKAHKENPDFVEALIAAYKKDLDALPKGGGYVTLAFQCESSRVHSMSERFVADLSHEAKNYGFQTSRADSVYWENMDFSYDKKESLKKRDKKCFENRQDYVVVNGSRKLPPQSLSELQEKCLDRKAGQRHYYINDPPFYGFEFVAKRCCAISNCLTRVKEAINSHMIEVHKNKNSKPAVN